MGWVTQYGFVHDINIGKNRSRNSPSVRKIVFTTENYDSQTERMRIDKMASGIALLLLLPQFSEHSTKFGSDLWIVGSRLDGHP